MKASNLEIGCRIFCTSFPVRVSWDVYSRKQKRPQHLHQTDADSAVFPVTCTFDKHTLHTTQSSSPHESGHRHPHSQQTAALQYDSNRARYLERSWLDSLLSTGETLVECTEFLCADGLPGDMDGEGDLALDLIRDLDRLFFFFSWGLLWEENTSLKNI